ncbi:MAG TPA: GNAT family N-acetyltransferase [Saprospiraceae bacterium]|nr:GNAT family N-acetyltransferase [Saprospiraceae bacterium]
MTNESTYSIRPPQSNEEWEVVKQLLIDYRNEFDDETCFTSFEDELNNIQSLYSDPRKYKLIAVEQPGGKIVGCVGLRALSPEVAEMKRLYVIPSHRGHLLGKKLSEEIITIASKMKFKTMVLDTMNEMQAAQKLYEDLGFVVTGPYNDQDLTKLVCYSKDLDPQA